jgi:hypothetical protein
MSKRFCIKLVGFIAIEYSFAAAPDYQAGTATAEHVRAVVLEDNRGNRAILAEAQFPINRTVSDFVAAQLAKQYGLDRGSLMIYEKGPDQPADRDALLTAITAALGSLEPAAVRYDGATISITTADGRCIAALPAGRCGGGARVRPPIRAAFQMVEGQHGLQIRGENREAYPVQAMALGKEVAILGLGGDARYAGSAGVVVVPFANDTAPPPASVVVDAAARRVLARVGR